MSLRFEDVIVQKPPARRVYCEHSLVTWRAPLRGEDSDNDRAPSAAATSAAAKPGTTFFGAAVSEQAVMLTEPMMAVAMRRLRRIILGSVQLRFATGDTVALGRADTTLHDRRAPPRET